MTKKKTPTKRPAKKQPAKKPTLASLQRQVDSLLALKSPTDAQHERLRSGTERIFANQAGKIGELLGALISVKQRLDALETVKSNADGSRVVRGEREPTAERSAKIVPRFAFTINAQQLLADNREVSAYDSGRNWALSAKPLGNGVFSIECFAVDSNCRPIDPTAPEPPGSPQASAEPKASEQTGEAAGASEAGNAEPWQWDIGAIAYRGDVVTHKGRVFRALKTNYVEPCGGPCWEVVGGRESTEPAAPAYDPVGWNPVSVSPIQPGKDARRFVVVCDPSNEANYRMVPVIAATLSEIIAEGGEAITHWREEPAPPQ